MKTGLLSTILLLSLKSFGQLFPCKFSVSCNAGIGSCCANRTQYFFAGKNCYAISSKPNKCVRNSCIEILVDTSYYFIDSWNLNLSDSDKTYLTNLNDSQIIELKKNTFNFVINDKSRALAIMNHAKDSIKRQRDSLIKIYEAKMQRAKAKGIAIIDWNISDESEYTEGTGFDIKIYNPTKKTIKYIWVSMVGKNPVGDPVVSRGKSIVMVKCIGPILPEEEDQWDFEYVWFSDLVTTAKITKIKVQYMDGTFKEILTPKDVIFTELEYLYATWYKL